MKAWKRISALVLALGLTAGFAACGGKTDKGSNSESVGNSEVSSSESVGNSEVSESESVGNSEVSESESVSSPEESESESDTNDSESAPVVGEPEKVEVPMGKSYQDVLDELFANLYAETNVTIVYTRATEVQGEETLFSGTAQFQNGKWYMEQTETSEYEEVNKKLYYGKVDGVDYVWSSLDDGESWESETCSTDVSTVKLIFEHFDKNGYLRADNPFGWDANTGMNRTESFTTIGAPYLEFKLIGGKIVEYRVLKNVNNAPVVIETGVITYGSATVGELPALTSAE